METNPFVGRHLTICSPIREVLRDCFSFIRLANASNASGGNSSSIILQTGIASVEVIDLVIVPLVAEFHFGICN